MHLQQKKKIPKYVFAFLNICAILNIIYLDIVILNNKINFSNFKDVIELIIPTINLIFVIWIAFKGFKDNQEEKKQDIKKYWYHDVLIQKYMTCIENLFNISLEVVNDMQNINFEENYKLRPIFREIKNARKDINNSFFVLLEGIDPQLATELNEELRNYEDWVTNKSIVFIKREISKEEFLKKIMEHQAKIYKILFNYDMRNV